MSQNLTMSPDLGTEDWDPDVITRMIFMRADSRAKGRSSSPHWGRPRLDWRSR